jgi:tRNA(His) 5'-end guanylyltransferase
MATPRKDDLGDRMKKYEAVTRFVLPRRTYTILRVDGRAFHSWTRGLAKPYDGFFMNLMDDAATALCEQIPGAQFAYVQSDEISVLAVDFLNINTEPWFEGNVQKWASISAAVATMAFNRSLMEFKKDDPEGIVLIVKKEPNAVFNARVFTIPDLIEVENYFVWRQQDAERNSVMMLARAYASHKQLAGKKRAEQHEIIHAAGDNWAKHPANFKHGRVVRKTQIVNDPISRFPAGQAWVADEETPVFTKNREYLRGLVPVIWDNDLLVRKAAENG